MRIYLECFDSLGGRILGNGNGQTVIGAKRWRRTIAYRNARAIVASSAWPWARVVEIRVVDERGNVLEVIR